MWNRLIDLGADRRSDMLTAWIAKEELRALLALARTHPTRHQISTRLWDVLPLVRRLRHPRTAPPRRTVEPWWPEIDAFIHTGITNATSEGINRVIKLVARNAFGFRNPTNQRLRSRCATIRATGTTAKPG